MRYWISSTVLRLAGRLVVWAYTQRAILRGWSPEQVKAAKRIAQQEQDAIWDSVHSVILWNKSEAEIVSDRLARRFDPGMTLNEVANRAIEAKKEARAGSQLTQLTSRQLAALEFQKNYLKGVVDRS